MMKRVTKHVTMFTYFIVLMISIMSLSSCEDDIGKIIEEENALAFGVISPWQKYSEFASPRSGALMRLDGSDVYLYGGKDSGVYRNDFWRINIDTRTEEILTSNDRKAYSAGEIVNGVFYIYGGYEYDGADIYHDELRGYDIAAGTWSGNIIPSGGPAPVDRAYHISIKYNNKIYFHGGKDSGGALNGILWEYDPGTNSVAQMPVNSGTPPRRYGHSAVLYNDYLVIYGGFDETDTLSNEIWIYDFLTGEWRNDLVSPVPASVGARAGTAMVVYYPYIVLCGGESVSEIHNDMVHYNFNTGTWSVITSAPRSSVYHSMMEYNNQLYFFGGYRVVNSIEVHNGYFYSYNPAIDILW